MSWTTIRSSIGGGRFDPPSGSSSNNNSRNPRLIKAIQNLRIKFLVKIQEIKKDLPMKLFFLLVGFYSATAFSTFIGQTGDWDVLSAALAVIIVECIGALMYRASIPIINKMRSTIAMFNYWKAGLALGLFLDSFNVREVRIIFWLGTGFSSDFGKQQQTNTAKPGSRMDSGQPNLTSCVPIIPETSNMKTRPGTKTFQIKLKTRLKSQPFKLKTRLKSQPFRSLTRRPGTKTFRTTKSQSQANSSRQFSKVSTFRLEEMSKNTHSQKQDREREIFFKTVTH